MTDRYRADDGVSLAEVIVIIPLIAIFGLMTMTMFTSVLSRTASEMNRSTALSASSLASGAISKAIRAAYPPVQGSMTAFASAGKNDITFYTYTAGSSPKRIRIYVDTANSNLLKMETTDAGSDLTVWAATPNRTEDFAIRLTPANISSGVFSFTDNTGTAITPDTSTGLVPQASLNSIAGVTYTFTTSSVNQDGLWKTVSPSDYTSMVRIPNNIMGNT